MGGGLVLAGLLLIVGISSGNAPIFVSEIFYCDGCLADLAVMKDNISLRTDPIQSAPAIQGPALNKGAKLESTREFMTRTISAGHIQVLKTTVIHGRSFGRINRLAKTQYDAAPKGYKQFSVDPGDQIEELQDLSEGSCLAKIKDQVIEVGACRWLEGFNPKTNPDEGHFKVLDKSKTETWIKVRNSGREGWVFLDELF